MLKSVRRRPSVRIFVSGANLRNPRGDFLHIPHIHISHIPSLVYVGLLFALHFSAKIALFILILLISGKPCQLAVDHTYKTKCAVFQVGMCPEQFQLDQINNGRRHGPTLGLVRF